MANENEIRNDGTAGLSPAYVSDVREIPRRKPGAQPNNFNAAKSLQYPHDIEDGRSLLAEGFRSHSERLLAMFNVQTLDDLDGIEREAVRRLVKRRVIRELAWGRVQTAFEQQDIDGFNIEIARFQDAADREERTEARVEGLLAKRSVKKFPDLQAYIRGKSRQREVSDK
jgi:hypothetical protein